MIRQIELFSFPTASAPPGTSPKEAQCAYSCFRAFNCQQSGLIAPYCKLRKNMLTIKPAGRDRVIVANEDHVSCHARTGLNWVVT